MEAQRIIEDFLSAYNGGGELPEDDSRHTSIWELDHLAEDEPEKAWPIILEIMSRSANDKVIEMLSAGPLEDLINAHGPAFIDRIEVEARRNPRFRHLLGGVWEGSTPEIWSRVEAARVKSW